MSFCSKKFQPSSPCTRTPFLPSISSCKSKSLVSKIELFNTLKNPCFTNSLSQSIGDSRHTQHQNLQSPKDDNLKAQAGCGKSCRTYIRKPLRLLVITELKKKRQHAYLLNRCQWNPRIKALRHRWSHDARYIRKLESERVPALSSALPQMGSMWKDAPQRTSNGILQLIHLGRQITVDSESELNESLSHSGWQRPWPWY